jgi:hypothetical protein
MHHLAAELPYLVAIVEPVHGVLLVDCRRARGEVHVIYWPQRS